MTNSENSPIVRHSRTELHRYAEEIRLVISSAIMNLDFVHVNPALKELMELPEDPHSDYYKDNFEYRNNVYATVLETWKLSSAALSFEHFKGINEADGEKFQAEYLDLYRLLESFALSIRYDILDIIIGDKLGQFISLRKDVMKIALRLDEILTKQSKAHKSSHYAPLLNREQIVEDEETSRVPLRLRYIDEQPSMFITHREPDFLMGL